MANQTSRRSGSNFQGILKIRELLGVLAEPEQSALAVGEENKAVKKLFQQATKEISDASAKPSQVQSSEPEFWNPKPVKQADQWSDEIRQASNPKYHSLPESIVLIESKPVQASWSAEVAKVAEQFYKGYKSELDQACREFLAKMAPKSTFIASVDNYDWSANAMNLSGIAVDFSVNKNGWCLRKEDAPKIIKDLERAYITLDHSKNCRDNIGQCKSAHLGEDGRIHFDGYIDDPAIMSQIRKGRIGALSIEAEGVGKCSVCDKITDGAKRTCKCEGGHVIIHDPTVKALSLVTRPAFPDAKVTKFEEIQEEEDWMPYEVYDKKKETRAT